jgi:predicted LPLAT superfamily acyltransferase
MNPNRRLHTTERLVAQLRELRGELQLKSHLASMDVRDAWNDIAPRLDAMAETLEESAKRGREQSKGLAQVPAGSPAALTRAGPRPLRAGCSRRPST